MKKIIYSGGVILVVAGLAISSTGAFFSDSETSTGNTFTAGAIDLKVDSEQHYNGNICTNTGTEEVPVYTWVGQAAWPVPGTPCDGTWTLTDLQNGVHKFWNFTDVKPGDEGENTISLHIDSNPAWACVDVALTSNDDVTCNDPENEAEGLGVCNADGAPTFDGELAQNLKFAAWADNGNNIWEVGEPLLFSNQSGPASDVLGGKTYTLADSSTGNPLPGGSTSYIGLAWCAGNQTVDPIGNTITCDGAGMGNDTQTDSMTADVTFRVEQHRNNPNFLCNPDEETGPTTATTTVDKVVEFSSITIEGVDVNDFQLHINGPGGDQIVVDQIPAAGLAPGVYTVSEIYSGDPAGIVFDAVFSGACSEIGISNTGTMTLAAGDDVTCTITNSVSPGPV